MSDEFKKKLEAIADRAKAARQKAPDATPELDAARENRNAASTDFENRIAPLVGNAVNTANSIIAADTGIRLEIKEGNSFFVEVRAGKSPPLPNITIRATRSS